MGLIEYKLGDLIELVEERNSSAEFTEFLGINIFKEFMPTVANTEEIDPSKYKVIRKNRFVFSGMQTGRDICIRIGLYTKNNPVIVSPAYTTFEIKRTDLVLPEYFFMIFLSKEKDRLGWFLSDSSVRSNLDWPRFCDIDIKLPSLEIQQKAVDAYLALSDNLKAYTDGLDDLKMTCDIYMDNIKKEYTRDQVGNLLKEIDVINKESRITNVLGINIEKSFMPSVANLAETDISKYKVIEKGQFAYSAMQTGRDETIRVALFDKNEKVVISPAYSVLQVKDNKVLPEYLMVWFKRKESDRLGWFMSDGSVRASLEVSRFFEIEIPIPPKEIQQSIVDIYHAQYERQEIAEKLGKTVREICPVLIKQSLAI
jgi:type I restriction enzyme S subunit